MKKVILIAASAMMIFASCSKVGVKYEGQDQPQQISIFSVNNSMSVTKAPVEGTAYPEDYKMDVVAYLASEEGGATGDYFAQTEFAFKSDSDPKVWVGNQYWPISNCHINFMALAKTGKTANTMTNALAKTVLTDNDEYPQTDVMYAAGYGVKEHSPAPTVDMKFKHALSWIVFTVKNATAGTPAPNITVNSITLNGVNVNGEFHVNNEKYTSTGTDCVTDNLTTPNWPSKGTAVSLAVGKPDGSAVAPALVLPTDKFSEFGGAMVIPSNQTSFTIKYEIEGYAQVFTYTHTLTPTDTWDMARKYTYNITITLKGIEIKPEVVEWEPVTSVDVPLV